MITNHGRRIEPRSIYLLVGQAGNDAPRIESKCFHCSAAESEVHSSSGVCGGEWHSPEGCSSGGHQVLLGAPGDQGLRPDLVRNLIRRRRLADMEVVMSQLTTITRITGADEVELDLARQIQSTFVPEICHGWPGARIAVKRLAGGGLGGDFHHVIRGLDERYSLVVGTIKGPVLPAAMAKAMLGGVVRKFGPITCSPRVLLNHLSRVVEHLNADLRDQRVTCAVFHGLVDKARGKLDYCSAGGCRPLVWTREGEVLDVESTGPALGDAAGPAHDSRTLELSRLRRLIIYTVGLSPVPSVPGESLGPVGGRSLLVDTMHLPVEEQVDAVWQTLRMHADRDQAFTDDATLFVADFEQALTMPATGSVKTLSRTFRETGEAAPDSSVFLG